MWPRCPPICASGIGAGVSVLLCKRRTYMASAKLVTPTQKQVRMSEHSHVRAEMMKNVYVGRLQVCDATENCSNCAQDCRRRNGMPCQRLGMGYSGWHYPAWNAVNNIGQVALTVEGILNSRTVEVGAADKYLRGTAGCTPDFGQLPQWTADLNGCMHYGVAHARLSKAPTQAAMIWSGGREDQLQRTRHG